MISLMHSAAPSITATQQHFIESIVGRDRARFDRRERRLYSHDVGLLPGPLRRLAGRTIADGVVRPNTEYEVVQLTQYAHAQGIPLVPRGKATSGYGGAVPAQGGLVVDLCGLKGLRDCDSEKLTVTVGAGTVWTDLEQALAERGLALRLFPSSAPASTVGGWLAQGGAGLGSHAYGWFADNVRGARIVTAAGEVREVHDDELLGIADAEGTTGIITELSLSVRRTRAQQHLALAWRNPTDVAHIVQRVTESGLPIWNITVVDPTMARLKNLSPHHGPSEQTRVRLAEDEYTVLFTFDAGDEVAISQGLQDLAIAGEWLSDATARYLWSERFKPMRAKRLGPSLIPVEVVVPTDAMPATLEEWNRCVTGLAGVEAVSVRGKEMVLLGMIPHDERTLGYTFGYGVVPSAIAAAERNGGRAYSTGRYFAGRAERILSAEKIEAIEAAKKTNDPDGVLNPGKVVRGTNALLDRLMDTAFSVEPLMRVVANHVGKPREPMERSAPNRRFLPDVAGHSYSCAQCGYCVDVCPQFHDDGWESSGPRGKWFLLKDVLEGRDHFDNQLNDIFGLCTHCGKCDEVCQLELPIEPSWRKVKSALFDGILTRTS